MSTKAPFYTLRNAGEKKAELLLYDVIGFGWDIDITALSIAKELNAMGEIDVIDVRINSPGGNVFHGLAIYNLLKDHKAEVHVYVDGLAGSIASVIAMAGDKITAAENAMIMIHNPAIHAQGEEKDLLRAIDQLRAARASILGIYTARTKLDAKKISDWLDAETYFGAPDALKEGFITHVSPNKAIAANFDASAITNLLTPKYRAAIAALGIAPTPKEEPPVKTEAEIKAEADAKAAADKVAADAKAAADAKVAADAKAAADAKEAAAKGSDDLIAQARADEQQRIREIMALCDQAGMSAKAKAFIDGNKSLADVRAELLTAMCAERAPSGDAGERGNGGDPTAAFKREYAANKAIYEDLGVTEAQFLTSRQTTAAGGVLPKMQPAAK